jgi:hypothetical protein
MYINVAVTRKFLQYSKFILQSVLMATTGVPNYRGRTRKADLGQTTKKVKKKKNLSALRCRKKKDMCLQ